MMVTAQLQQLEPDSAMNVQGQMALERQLQQFFKITPPLKIEDQFSRIHGNVSNQFIYLNLALKVIEELDVEPVQAFGLLEAIRPVIFEKVRIITSRFIGRTISSTSRHYDIVFNAIGLFSRLTATYDSVIEEAKYFGESQAFIMGSAIHRALADKSRLILCYQQLYQEIPDNIWRHVNKLYLTAEEYNIFTHAIPDKLVFNGYTLSIRQIYLYTMLMASAGTSKLGIEDIVSLSELLKSWMGSIGFKLSCSDDEDLLCIDPMHMLTPCFKSQISEFSPDHIIYFDLEKLRKKLSRSHVNQVFINNHRYTLPTITVNNIVDNWTMCHPRSGGRIEYKSPVYATTLIGLTFGWLLVPPAPSVLSECTRYANEFKSRRKKLNISSSQVSLVSIPSIQQEMIGSFSCHIIDHGHSGYCLEWPEAAYPHLGAGEVILIQDPLDNTCKLGQIVWLKFRSGRIAQTGISVISKTIYPALLRPLKRVSTDPDPKTHKTLVVLNRIGERETFCVLIAKHSVMTGQIIELIQGERSYFAQLLEQCGQTEKYQIFNIAFYE